MQHAPRITGGRRAAVAIITVAIVASACGSGDDAAPQQITQVEATDLGPGAPDGVVGYEVARAEHVTVKVDYPQTPPVGGDHAGAWQNCRFYDDPVVDENAVHALEHGAIWITYDATASQADLDLLRDLARRETHILVSRHDEQDSAFVLTAWGRQLTLDDPNDERLAQFISAYIRGGVSPEPGAPCDGGVD